MKRGKSVKDLLLENNELSPEDKRLALKKITKPGEPLVPVPEPVNVMNMFLADVFPLEVRINTSVHHRGLDEGESNLSVQVVHGAPWQTMYFKCAAGDIAIFLANHYSLAKNLTTKDHKVKKEVLEGIRKDLTGLGFKRSYDRGHYENFIHSFAGTSSYGRFIEFLKEKAR